MDDARAQRLLATIGSELGDRVIMWRGAELTGSDVDLLVLGGARGALESVLARDGLTAGPDGHWADPVGDLMIDLLDESDWPAAYPSAAGMTERAQAAGGTPPVAAPEDRVLIFAAEAVAGRPLAKLLPKLRSLAGGGELAERALAVGRRERAASLARLGLDPDRIAGATVRGALSYRLALGAGLGSRRGRAALRTRLAATAARRLRALRGSDRRSRPPTA